MLVILKIIIMRQGKAIEYLAAGLAVVITWSATGADPTLFGWGAGAQASLRALRDYCGDHKEIRKILKATGAGLADKVTVKKMR